MTADEYIEWKYRRDERIAILCGLDTPTASQTSLASAEADAALRNLLGQEQELPF